MKKKIITIAALCTLLAFNKANAQNWDASSVKTITSTGTPRVGIGTATPNSELEIQRVFQPSFGSTIFPMQFIHENLYTGGMSEPIVGPYNLFEIKSTRTYGPLLVTFPPPPPPPVMTKTNFFVNNNTPNETIVGINKSTGNHTLDVGGTINADNRVIAENDLTVNKGAIKLNHPSDWDRSITANTTSGALNIFAGTSSDDACIRLFGRTNGAAPGGIQYITRGTSGSETAHAFFTYHGSGWNNLFLIKKDGKINIPGLATGSSKMVVADAVGTLVTQNMPTAQTLSISGQNLSISSGNTVTLPSGGDDLGSHQASMNLNMFNKDITSCEKIHVKEVNFSTCKFNSSTNGLTFTGSGTYTMFVGGGALSGRSEKLYVYGDAYATGVWNTSDRKYKQGIESVSSVKNDLFRIQPSSYHYRAEEYPQRNFDNGLHFGFIAQDVEKIYPNLVRNVNGDYSVNYIEFVPLLLQALKEEDQQVQALQQKVNNLEAEKENTTALQNKLSEMEKQLAAVNNLAEKLGAQQATIAQLQNKLATVNDNTTLVNNQQKTIDNLLEKIAIMEADMNICCQAKNTHTDDVKAPALKSSLDQNVPNPFNADTKIGFNIVGDYQTAFIGIYDLNGKQIKTIPVEQGMNHVMFNNNNMMPGMYVYSLVVDNQLVDAKKMIIAE